MSKSALWIRVGNFADAVLGKALAARGLRLICVDAPEQITQAMERDAAALLVDAKFIDDLPKLRRLLTDSGGKPLPLLVLSSNSDLETHLSALRQGADAFFPSPLDVEAMTDKLTEMLALQSDGSGFKVMVVDDDPTQANFAAAILRKADVEVCTAVESLKVLETLRECMPDLILMDVYMPDASGVELTTVIRAQKEFMDIPIVYLSAEHDPDKQLDALSVGGEDFLTKPIRPKHLLATVRNRVARARQLREGAGAARRESGDPALVRKHILELLERIHTSPAAAEQATGLMYIELDTPILLLEQVNLDGIDEAMTGVRDTAVALCREGDRVTRFGDFCMVIIAQRNSADDLARLAHELKQAIDAKRFDTRTIAVGISVSIGLRLLQDHEKDASKLINEAIRACHEARAGGDSGVQVHRVARVTEERKQTSDEALLERVVDTANLQIHYQPIVPLQGDQDSLYQCLLRLRSAEGGLLSAGDFLPMVEQTGKILKLDRWVILKALVVLRKLCGRDRSRPLRLIVNQAPSALKDVARIRWLADSLAKVGIEGRCLVLEFRFPDIARDMAAANEYLSGLRRLGLGITLNITREMDALVRSLERFPADYIKITENQIRSNPNLWAKLVETAHRLDMRVIVSRIEHPELLGQLWANQVDYIQGYFIQHPGEELNYDFSGAVLG